MRLVVHPIIYNMSVFTSQVVFSPDFFHQEYCKYIELIELLCFKCKIELNTCTTNARKRSVLKNLCFRVSNHPVMCHIIHYSDSSNKLCFFLTFVSIFPPPPKKHLLHQRKLKRPLTSWVAIPSNKKIISLSVQVVSNFPPRMGENSTQVFELPPPMFHSLKLMIGLDDSSWDRLFLGFATATCCNQDAIKAASAKSRCSPSLPPNQNSPALKLVRVLIRRVAA